ncbi:uncharacterized protein LOC126678496 [Mercurialis annua]|uniref:uncharacterized protein LOC126678496 n=1 Tax=Mercurialis annua TaxID=3986 RepID=UPI0024AF1C10|nr:uncharacterized protein LOC126678496 [Mercurialis annua]
MGPCTICGQKFGKGASPHSPCKEKRKELTQNTANLKRIVNKIKRGKGKRQNLGSYNGLENATTELEKIVAQIPRHVIEAEYGRGQENEIDQLMEEAEELIDEKLIKMTYTNNRENLVEKSFIISE